VNMNGVGAGSRRAASPRARRRSLGKTWPTDGVLLVVWAERRGMPVPTRIDRQLAADLPGQDFQWAPCPIAGWEWPGGRALSTLESGKEGCVGEFARLAPGGECGALNVPCQGAVPMPNRFRCQAGRRRDRRELSEAGNPRVECLIVLEFRRRFGESVGPRGWSHRGREDSYGFNAFGSRAGLRTRSCERIGPSSGLGAVWRPRTGPAVRPLSVARFG
jgi:hypothetical protein